MTLLLSWVGYDSRKISSFYIASDSRFSTNRAGKYDYGRKVFAFVNSADIIGYCGDVYYSTHVLSQIQEMDRDGILFPKSASGKEKSEILFREIKKNFEYYEGQFPMDDTIEILHASRYGETDFTCKIYSWIKKGEWKIIPVEIPAFSDKVIILGSGKDEFFEKYLQYYKGLGGKTSRSLFQCLCHTLFKMKDPKCGGAPQLVGLYNRFNAKNFGIIYEGKCFYLGREIDKSEMLNNIEWRNELFERYDGNSNSLIEGAQRQINELRPE